MRLIDADELEKAVICCGRGLMDEGNLAAGGAVLAVEDYIRNAPTITPTPQWIPVTERLPEIYRDEYRELIPFLVCVKGTEYPFRAFYDGKNWGNGWDNIAVIAWMPLPEPYKMDGKDGDGE